MGALASASELSRRLGHDFKRPELLDLALMHSSMLANADEHAQSYERLEFLGDRVLGLVCADMLLEAFPDENEGQLARRHVALVRQEALVRVARSLDLGRYINLAKSEDEGGGRSNPALLADACEAVIAALYIDGGLEAAAKFVHCCWRDMLAETPSPPKDAKTSLQEWAQARGLALPVYRELTREGPAHSPMFTVEVEIAGKPSISARGASKRTAEQRCAEEMLKKVKDV